MTTATSPGNLRGIVLMTVAMATAASTDALIKIAAARVPSVQILVVIGFGCLIFFGAIALWKGEQLFSRDFFHPAALTRSVGDVIGTGSIVLALPLIPISLLTVIIQSVPILVTFGALVVLGEKAGWRRWLSIFIGFCGVFLILRPGAEPLTPGILLAALAALGQAIRDLASRATPARISTLQVTVWGFSVFALAALALAIRSGEPVARPDIATIGLLAAIILLAGAIALLVTSAMRSGDVGVIAPFRYSRLIFGLGIGVVFFAESLDLITLLGGALVVGSGLYTWHREYVIRRRQLLG